MIVHIIVRIVVITHVTSFLCHAALSPVYLLMSKMRLMSSAMIRVSSLSHVTCRHCRLGLCATHVKYNMCCQYWCARAILVDGSTCRHRRLELNGPIFTTRPAWCHI